MALSTVLVLGFGVLGVVMALGDQREFTVVRSVPGAADSVPSTLGMVQLSFSVEPDRRAIERSLTLEPPVEGMVRWRGQTLEFRFTAPLAPGSYELRIAAGNLGAGGEPLDEGFTLPFVAREPGVVLVARDADAGLAVRDGTVVQQLAADQQIRHYSVSPDGQTVAVVTGSDAGEPGILQLVPNGPGEPRVIVDDPALNVEAVYWSSDSQALLVLRRDRRPEGEGVPRLWYTLLTGDFIAPIDPEGEPTLAAAWSPDTQTVAYLAPATARLLARNLATQEAIDLGVPRGDPPAWSPDSRLVTFTSVPEQSTGDLVQPIRVRSLDGTVDRFFGAPGEVRSVPRFLDNETVVSLRRVIGSDSRGVELLFESVESGALLRAVVLAPGQSLVPGFDFAPGNGRVLYEVQSGQARSVLILDLESGRRTSLDVAGERARWLP